MASLLVIFDVVISYPKHPDTNTNLALLDVGGGHFSRIEYASAGWLPGSLLTQFSQIAREYVSRGKTNDGSSVPPGRPQTERVASTSLGKAPQPALGGEPGDTSDPPLQPTFDTMPVSNRSLWKMMISRRFGRLNEMCRLRVETRSLHCRICCISLRAMTLPSLAMGY